MRLTDNGILGHVQLLSNSQCRYRGVLPQERQTLNVLRQPKVHFSALYLSIKQREGLALALASLRMSLPLLEWILTRACRTFACLLARWRTHATLKRRD